MASRLQRRRSGRTSSRKPARSRPRLELLEQRVMLSTFQVVNTNDIGAGSLRQALIDANATPNIDTSGDGIADPDLVIFAIPGAGVQTIRPASALPSITDAVVIDGYTQPGSQANTNSPDQGGTNAILQVELNGSVVGGAGLSVLAGGTTVRGLVINRFTTGVLVRTRGNNIEGNFIGTTASGDAGAGNTSIGVLIQSDGADDASNNTVGGASPEARNLISGNGRGVVLESAGQNPMTGNRILGNLIGTDRTGRVAVGNTGDAVQFLSERGAVLRDNVIGGATASARNVISGNGSGILIDGSAATANLVQGNFIGVDATGGTRLANNGNGILLGFGSATNANTISGNVISGNRDHGVMICPGSSGNLLVGNFIGTNATGTAAIGNGSSSRDSGILIGSASGNIIGDPNLGPGNLISGNNGMGVDIEGNSTRQPGPGQPHRHRRHRDPTPAATASNGVQIEASGTANGNIIGGTAPRHRQPHRLQQPGGSGNLGGHREPRPGQLHPGQRLPRHRPGRRRPGRRRRDGERRG